MRAGEPQGVDVQNLVPQWQSGGTKHRGGRDFMRAGGARVREGLRDGAGVAGFISSAVTERSKFNTVRWRVMQAWNASIPAATDNGRITGAVFSK